MLDALVAHLPREAAPPSRQNSLALQGGGSNPASPIVTPATALDMLVAILSKADSKFPAEMRANVCTLVAELGKENLKAEAGGREVEVERLRGAVRPALLAIQGSPESLALSGAAKAALQAWVS